MLYWCCLCGWDADDPGLEYRPRRWLSSDEWEMYRSFPALRRQKDWLAGRLAAKSVLQAALQDATGKSPEMSSICITNHPNGAPHPCFVDQGDCKQEDFPFHLSISHRDAKGFAAATSKEYKALGADLERIEHRMDGFAEEFFSNDELGWLEKMAGDRQDDWITAIWSAKEASLKALGFGLSVDTRWLTVEPVDNDRELDRNWLPFRVGWDSKRWNAYFTRQSLKPYWLKSTKIQNLSDLPVLKGYWRQDNGYILSLAYSGQGSPIFEEVHQAW